jgi:hypothetical protein
MRKVVRGYWKDVAYFLQISTRDLTNILQILQGVTSVLKRQYEIIWSVQTTGEIATRK